MTVNESSFQINIEELVLSQRLSQLSITSNGANARKLSSIGQHNDIEMMATSSFIDEHFYFGIDDNNESDSALPSYLLAKNELFDQIIQKTMNTLIHSIDIGDLR